MRASLICRMTPNRLSGRSLNREGLLREREDLSGEYFQKGVFHVMCPQSNKFPLKQNEYVPFQFDQVADTLAQGVQPVFLGFLNNVPHFSLSIPLQEGKTGKTLRNLMHSLDDETANVLAYVQGIHLWREKNKFCGSCGDQLISIKHGHALECHGCSNIVFPRVDPAAIFLIYDGDFCVLGRQASWEPNRYSTLAGFVETGESLEDGVKREAFEEVGIEIETKNVTYHSSQPWPFPQSLMIGFMVEAQKCEIKLTDEIEDAQWFSKEQIRNRAVILPPSTSISRRLINEFVQDKQ